jgi:hypothetical protein
MKISCAYTEDNLDLILIELFYYAIKKKKVKTSPACQFNKTILLPPYQGFYFIFVRNDKIVNFYSS